MRDRVLQGPYILWMSILLQNYVCIFLFSAKGPKSDPSMDADLRITNRLLDNDGAEQTGIEGW